jgi:hypothetical protein
MPQMGCVAAILTAKLWRPEAVLLGLRVGFMASIEVDALGLSALANHCEEQALRVSSTATPPFSGGGSQPSAAALAEVFTPSGQIAR